MSTNKTFPGHLDLIIEELLSDYPQYKSVKIPSGIVEKQNLMRSLMNVRPPSPVSVKFIESQNEELRRQLNIKGIVDSSSIVPSAVHTKISLWKGDITRLAIDAIVNAANSQMLGCFIPMHGCIDNAIHSAAGIQLRQECYELMEKQGYKEPSGKAKISKAYNLPSKYVIHTVGPVVLHEDPTSEDDTCLASCYQSCLSLADDYQLEGIALCCISTGEFHFPNQRAAEIAVKTTLAYLNSNSKSTLKKVVFNVYKDMDYNIYQKLLRGNNDVS